MCIKTRRNFQMSMIAQAVCPPLSPIPLPHDGFSHCWLVSISFSYF